MMSAKMKNEAAIKIQRFVRPIIIVAAQKRWFKNNPGRNGKKGKQKGRHRMANVVMNKIEA